MTKPLHTDAASAGYDIQGHDQEVHWGFWWRLLGGVALVVYAAIMLTFFRFLLRNVVVSLLFCLSAAIAAYGAWLVFSGKGSRKRLGVILMAVGVLSLVAELVYMAVAISSFWALAVFVLLLGAYVLLTSRLRGKYWSEARRQGEIAAGPIRFKNPYLIINPKAGNGRAVKANVEKLAKSQGIRVIMLRKGDDVENAARVAAKEGADVLGISGGDGSIGAVVKIALERGLPVVVLPGGTRCHFARDIGLDPERIADSLAGFHGVERRIDVGEINGRIFLNNASFGLYADIIDSPDYRVHKLETARNVLQSIADGKKPPYDLQFRHGSHRYMHAAEVLVGVNSYQTLNLFELGRRNKLDAGVLQVTVIKKLDDPAVRQLLRTMSIAAATQRPETAGIDQWETGSFRVTNEAGKIVAGVDGERETLTTPVSIRILPKALRIFVPAEGVRNRPENTFSWHTVKQIGHMVGPAGSGSR